ncbi:MAG: DUF4915 domain-containing protein [Halieaceae bacterium]
MNNDIWLDWDELNIRTANRSVFFFGCSQDWVPKALKNISNQVIGFVDNSDSFLDKDFAGRPVKTLKDWNFSKSGEFFLITSGQYEEIVSELISHGYEAGRDFVCSPDFKDYAEVERFCSRRDHILFSSSDYPSEDRARGSKYGGGLFLLDSGTGKFDRVLNGSYRQFEIVDDFIFAIDHIDGRLLKLNHSFDLIEELHLGDSGWCGLTYCVERRVVLVANPTSDQIVEVSRDKLAVLSVRSWQNQVNGPGGHHMNDLESMNGTIVASYFSLAGDKHGGAGDGGASAVTLSEYGEQYFEGLSKPHSPRFIDGRLWILDSNRGRLLASNGEVDIHVGGFARGLDIESEVAAVGQSQCMYLVERPDKEQLVDAACGINFINLRVGLRKFIPVLGPKNIHDLRFWNH